MKPNYIFETEMEVRDYECDIQGIVNNANYLHYTEHTRHLFLTSLGVTLISFTNSCFILAIIFWFLKSSRICWRICATV